MRRSFSLRHRITCLGLALGMFAIDVAAQSHLESERRFIEKSGDGWWYTLYFLVGIFLGAAFFIWRRYKERQPTYKYENRYAGDHRNIKFDLKGANPEQELEWLRRANRSNASPSRTAALEYDEAVWPADPSDIAVETKLFQERMRRLQYAQLPINSFSQLAPVKRYTPLPVSEDDDLLTAIEQAHEEYEEDEAVREVALRVLAAFRMRNSVDSLSQIALYDLSSNLRSKAVAALTEFDHESVFETILLACADPTREVRATAARGLFRLSFDRAHAWKRIIQTEDGFRMSHAARAAVESGIVAKSFDRLVNEDLKIAYEAFALVSLLIKAGETDIIFTAIRRHKDERVKFALLHVLKVHKDERTRHGLNQLRTEGTVPPDVVDRVNETVKSFMQPVTA
jgi:hypothetical protein